MLSVPAQMQPTLDSWKKNLNLGDGMKFGASSRPESYQQMMDQVVLADNGSNDSSPEAGLVVCKDDGETIRFKGNSNQGSMEAVTADGRVVALNFTDKAVDFLQLTAKPEGVEALHEHHDRQTGKGWMQLSGAVTVINMDEPGALDSIFNPAPPAAPGQELARGLATKLGVDPSAVQVTGYETQKGFNPGDCGFPVSGELSMSAWTEGIEAKFSVGEDRYVYRGIDQKSGRTGVDVEHEGYWKADERGIYRPDHDAKPLDAW
ncbi:MAG: hypothetical protein U0931_14250 [Vulcanimicrobiota bacterium]